MRFSLFLALLFALGACGGRHLPPDAPSSKAGASPREAAIRGDLSAEAIDTETLQSILGEEPRAPIPLNRKRARLGAADAEITILFFSDLECPYCAIAMRTLISLMERNPGKIRLYQIHFPLPSHIHADGAARIAEALRVEQGDAAFYAFIERLKPDERRLSEVLLREIALESGLSEAALEGALDEYNFDDEVRGDAAIGRLLGLRGTPASLINGRLIPGARALEEFQAVLNEELQITEELRSLGIARGEEYHTLVRHYFGDDGLLAMEGND